ncbi:MAG: hypothetical protein ACFFKA_10535 [Candidatus Thorarchaeota archaeon]
MSKTITTKIAAPKESSFTKVVKESCLKERISPTTIETLLGQSDKDVIFKSLVSQTSVIIPFLSKEEQVKIFKDLIKISEAI